MNRYVVFEPLCAKFSSYAHESDYLLGNIALLGLKNVLTP